MTVLINCVSHVCRQDKIFTHSLNKILILIQSTLQELSDQDKENNYKKMKDILEKLTEKCVSRSGNPLARRREQLLLKNMRHEQVLLKNMGAHTVVLELLQIHHEKVGYFLTELLFVWHSCFIQQCIVFVFQKFLLWGSEVGLDLLHTIMILVVFQ